MKVILAETSLIRVTICEFEYPYSMLHATAPISLVLGARQEIIPPIPMNFIFYKNTRIFFSIPIIIRPPTIFSVILYFALIVITVTVCNFYVSVRQFLSQHLSESFFFIICCSLFNNLLLIFLRAWTILQILLLSLFSINLCHQKGLSCFCFYFLDRFLFGSRLLLSLCFGRINIIFAFLSKILFSKLLELFFADL